MKNLKVTIYCWFDWLDECWRRLPIGKQRRYTLYLFIGYLVLTIGVMFKVWFDTANSDNNMIIERIKTHVLKE